MPVAGGRETNSGSPATPGRPVVPSGALRGFLAVGKSGRHEATTDAASPDAATPDPSTLTCGAAALTHWGLPSIPGSASGTTFVLSRVTRDPQGAVSDAAISRAMSTDPASLTRLLPPFAAVRGDEHGVTMVADSMGFRQLFHSTPETADAVGPPVLSTSALIAGWARGAELDHTAVAVQSLLGWQLGQRTLFRGVDKLAPGACATLDSRGIHITEADPAPHRRISLDKAVALTASLLRDSLAALLDDHPDAVLQLTGGQDSRLLLSAIPQERRTGLRAMTLGVPGSGDVTVASHLAQLYGLDHEVHGLASLDGLGSDEAWALAHRAAVQVDGMADPIALAALTAAEANFDQGVRISGLGGEVARGFYYVGAVHERSYTRKDAEHLASWRMFANEAVEPHLLTPQFSAWARATATNEVFSALRSGGDEWFAATDELYLRHRMQRWAGATDTAVGDDRIVINPMLCQEFLIISSRLAPQDKAQSRFLARVQLALDPSLARIPLEGRPAPIAMANPNAWRSAHATVATGKRFARKLGQRLRRENRAPAGGFVLATKVVDYWREHPELLSSPELSSFVRDEWIDGMLSGTIAPRPSSVAFLTNLVVASGAAAPAPSHRAEGSRDG